MEKISTQGRLNTTRRAQENGEIVEWRRERDEKYTSPEIQKELLEALAPGMMRQISANIQNATFFTIIAGETADVSNKEQLVICIRWKISLECIFGKNKQRKKKQKTKLLLVMPATNAVGE